MIWRLPPDMVAEEITKSGAHEKSFPIFNVKSEFLTLKIDKVRTPAANILKQEMLALGGDAVTPMSTILGEGQYVGVLLLGTCRQLNLLVQKLGEMPFFGLDGIKKDLEKLLQKEDLQTTLRNGKKLSFDKTLVMGILNLTPDSFYAQSRMDNAELLVRAEKMLAEGADILDLGAESTRPGAKPVSEDEEIKRLLPGLKALREVHKDVLISVDTYHANTAQEALQSGADFINDVSGKDSVAMQKVVELYHAPWILTHNGAGGILEVTENLLQRAEKIALGKDKIILDPGICFGKTAEENLDIIKNLKVLTEYGYPVLLGASRKSVIGVVLNLPPEERLEGTLAISAKAVEQGANIIRVHDVKENVRTIRMAEAIN